jgi:hypothetical protein
MSEAHTADLGTRYRYRLEGAGLERERILEAVEQWRNNLLNSEPYTNEELAAQRDSGYSDNFDYLIALIKGEQK